MITLKCIEIYEKYGGNEDGFLRCATSEERLLLNYSYCKKRIGFWLFY